MVDWNEEIEDETDDEEEAEDDDDEGADDDGEDEIDADETDDDEAGEDLIALNAIGAMLEIDGDSEVARASREALSAISDSAMALKARRQAREQREALEQAAERERQEAQAREEEERARREAHERADQRAEAERQERARLAAEAQQLARERERLRIELEQFETRRSEENTRRAASKQAPAHIPARIRIEPVRHERVERNDVPQHPFHDRAQVRRPAEPDRHVVPVREDEASKVAHQQQRAPDEQKWREAVRREEEARHASRDRTAALAAQAQPVAARPPVISRKKPVKQHKAGGRRSDAASLRAKRPAMPATHSSRPVQVVSPSPPRQPIPPRQPRTPRPDPQRVASTPRATVAFSTADLVKKPHRAKPPVPRPTQPDRQASLTGADLANWRSRLGLTQQAAANRLGVGQGTISKAESKGAVPLGPALLRAFAAALAREQRNA